MTRTCEWCVGGGRVQRELHLVVLRQQPRLHTRAGPSVVPNVQRIRRLCEWCTWICLLVRPEVPRNGLRGAVNNTVCRSDRVCVAVIAHGLDGEMRGHREHVREIPADGHNVILCDFEVRRRGLWRLGDGETASGR